MPGTKRGVDAELEGAHPDRKKRVKYTEDDAQLAAIYNDLADEVQAVRIKAASELLKKLSTKAPDFHRRLDSTEGRLIKGLCSGRKAARLGFSIALAEVFRLRFSTEAGDSDIALEPPVRRLANLTEVHGNVSGQERRDYLIGRRFACQAILHSDVGLNDKLPAQQWQHLIEYILDLAQQKPWLRRECGYMLYEYMVSASGKQLPSGRVQDVMEACHSKGFLQSPEGVGIWLTVSDAFPSVKLPKGVWSHKNPLSSSEATNLSKLMLENAVRDDDVRNKAGSRQVTPSFAWKVVLSSLYRDDKPKHFRHFWEETVVNGMFSTSSTAERRSLGLQVFSLALTTAPDALLPDVMHKNILRCILDQRAENSRSLFDAAKAPLSQMVSRAKSEPALAAVFVCSFLAQEMYNVDQATKTKTMESLVQAADEAALKVIIGRICQALDTLRADGAADNQTRMLADLILLMVRQRKDSGATDLQGPLQRQSPTNWLTDVLAYLSEYAYDPRVPQNIRTIYRSRLSSCLNALLDCPLEHSLKAPMFVVTHIERKKKARKELPKETMVIINQASVDMGIAFAKSTKDDAGARAFALLLGLSILQVYNQEQDAVAALEDLLACYDLQSEKRESIAMLVEILLSFVSKQSALFRKLAEQVFSAFAADLTVDGMQSLLDILEQKESLSGQQELFADGEDGHEDDDEGSSSGDDEGIDVEDASDVELVNGKEDDGSDSDDSEGSSGDTSDAEEGAEDDDEEAVFDRKLAEALGTQGMNVASDDDGSDMDDEQMMAIEPHLTTIFKERQKTTSKKQDKKDAKDNIVNFKNRVLDLLAIFVKSQPHDPLAIDTIVPLTTLVRTTTSKPTAEKAFAVLRQYFETCSKKKSLPDPDNPKVVFSILATLHDEMKLGGSKLHANACSRSSLFLSKVLTSQDPSNYKQIASMYSELQTQWWLDPKSKVQGSVFTEWTSWSIGRRKQN